MSEPEPESIPVGMDEGGTEDASSDIRKAAPSLAPETAGLLEQLTVGRVIDAKYKIDAVIGKGAMGVVLAATHIHLKEKVALKFLSTGANVQGDDFRSRFRREAQVSAKLRNEHITRVLDVGLWNEKYPFMVMDLLVGDDLRVTLRNTPDRRLDVAIALDYVVQVCEGLAEAHAHGIVHRDLKPSNLFVTKRPDGSDLIKILDFGISKWSDQQGELDDLTQTGIVLGSPKYMSPEQLFGASEVDSRADVWSLGAIFYETLTGRPPYDFPTITRLGAALAANQRPPSVKSLVPDIHPGIDAVVMRCFAIEREDRIPNVAALAGELLDSIGAPFAGEVRAKIGAILDPRRSGDGTLSSSGATAIGPQSYKSITMSGTHSSLSSSAALKRLTDSAANRVVTPGALASTEAVPSSQPMSEPPKRRLVIVALFGVVFLAVGAAFLLGRRSEQPPLPATAPSSLVTSSPAPSAPPSAGPTAAIAAGTPSSSPSTAPAVAQVSPAASSLAKDAPHPPPYQPHWTPPPRVNTAPATKPPPAATSSPAPPPVAPTPPPTPKGNPLDDRQ